MCNNQHPGEGCNLVDKNQTCQQCMLQHIFNTVKQNLQFNSHVTT